MKRIYYYENTDKRINKVNNNGRSRNFSTNAPGRFLFGMRAVIKLLNRDIYMYFYVCIHRKYANVNYFIHSSLVH